MDGHRKLAFVVMIASYFAIYLVFPFCIWLLANWLEGIWIVPRFFWGMANYVVAVIILIPNLIVSAWTVFTLWYVGSGTAAPIVATQKLIISGPFRYCRNPMYGSMMCVYLAVSIIFGSLVMLAFYILFAIFMYFFIRCWEEQDLEKKFGQEYRQYKAKTPFVIPRIPKE
jgi:protein-S-isoprenylcysteine O-methyltransferase Ste14